MLVEGLMLTPNARILEGLKRVGIIGVLATRARRLLVGGAKGLGSFLLARNPHGTSNRPPLEANLLIRQAFNIAPGDRSR